MATIHPEATITPGKTELITAWLPKQHWYAGPAGQRLHRVGSYRFDDPAGEVGIETILMRGQDDGRLYQIPMTYRAAELADGELMTTMEHTVLGLRHVYAGTSDPVFRAVFAAAMLERARQAEQLIVGGENDGVAVPSGVEVRGSGRLAAGDGEPELVVPHLIPTVPPSTVVATLEGHWTDGSGPVAWLV